MMKSMKLSAFACAIAMIPGLAVANDNKSSSQSSTTQSAQSSSKDMSQEQMNREKMADQSKVSSSATSTVWKAKAGQDYQVITFKKGSSQLSSAAKSSLKSLVDAAKVQGGEIDSLHVAVWSDKAFPKGEKAELSDKDQDLAKKRIDTVEKYLEDQLKVDNVETYSMAEKENWFSRAFNTDEGELKSLFSQQGAPAKIEPVEFNVVRTSGGPSKAVILVEKANEAPRADRDPQSMDK